jgi:hypothetical protein
MYSIKLAGVLPSFCDCKRWKFIVSKVTKIEILWEFLQLDSVFNHCNESNIMTSMLEEIRDEQEIIDDML